MGIDLVAVTNKVRFLDLIAERKEKKWGISQ